MLVRIKIPRDTDEQLRFLAEFSQFAQEKFNEAVTLDVPHALRSHLFAHLNATAIQVAKDEEEVWDPPATGGYHSYESLLCEINALVALAPSFVSKVCLGLTYQNRHIIGLRIKPASGAARKRVLLVGCHHARERISVEVPFLAGKYIILKALQATLPSFMRQTEVLVVPMLNPDGHSYLNPSDQSWNWRKNRSPQADEFGVDLNRNYPHNWGYGTESGKAPILDNYKGPSALSERETQAIEKLFDNAKPQFDALISYHSCGQQILYPWAGEAYTPGDARIDDLAAVACAMAQASRDIGSEYTALSASEVYDGPFGGELGDWAMAHYGISSLAVELPPKHGGVGFKLRAREIYPSFRGHLPALLKFFEWVDR